MRAFPQLVCYAVSFSGALILGGLFSIAFWQVRFRAEHLLNGKPLPALTQFLIDNHHLPTPLLLLPWVAMIGLPLFSKSETQNYFDRARFVVWYLAFVSVEIGLLLILLLALFMPFIPIYKVLRGIVSLTIVETSAWGLFWVAVCLSVAAGGWRFIKSRKQPRST